MNIAYFISDHGFGHATRASAVMSAVRRVAPSVHFEIFTQTPDWLFQDLPPGAFAVHPLLADIGVVQSGPLLENLPLTLQRLNAFLPFDSALVADLAQKINRLRCALVVCDIAPLGLAVARAAGRPSVLVENFTWDWIYAGYTDREPGLKAHIAYLQEVFASADYRIQTEPANRTASAHLVTRPVSRPPRQSRDQTRSRLGISHEASVVLVTMGGIPATYEFWDQLIECAQVYFIVSGGSEAIIRRGNLIRLPQHSDFFHPDLVNACDAVVGKVGYSTLSEVYHAGLPFGYVSRELLCEMKVLKAFIKSEMQGIEIAEAEFESAAWAQRLPELLALSRSPQPAVNGACQAADFICRLLQLPADVAGHQAGQGGRR
jgi:hypothetical protein